MQYKHTIIGLTLTSVLLGGLFFNPQVSEASWNFNSLSWVTKIITSLTRTKVNSSYNNSVTSGLVGLWSFNGPDMINGTVFDRSGQGNNMYFVNMATSTAYVAGKMGQGLFFESGTVDYLEGQDVSTYDFGTGDFSVSVWFKTTFAGAGARLVSIRSICMHDVFWETNVGAGLFGGCVDDGATTSCVQSNTTVNDDEWHHGVFTRSGTALTLYVDGVLDNTGTADSIVDLSSSAPLRIGDSVCNNDYTGDIDEVRIYNRNISATEVKQLYKMAR
ncbi:LamG domain-containing protein [Patescibacteria group bacterium]|nr:MAG: LamG domain-containing protein [Patescibacteria group bacterium]